MIMCRNVLFLSVFLIGLFFILSCTNRTTTISGAISRETKLLYSNPDLAICHDGFLDTLMSDDKGRFELRLDLKEGRFIIVKISDSGKKYLLPVLPGENYEISIGKNNELLACGPNKEGIELYQSILNYEPGVMDWSMFKNDTFSRDEMIERSKQEDLTKFKKLLDNKKITPAFYKLIASDRDCFYAFVSVFLSTWDMLKIYRNQETDITEDDIINRYKIVFDRYKPDDEDLMKSSSWDNYVLLQYIKFYKQFSMKRINENNVELLYSEQHFPFWLEQIKQSFSDKILESALALLLYTDGELDTKTSISLHQYLEKKFPVSPYLKYFRDQMNRMMAFYAGEGLDSSIRFIENGDSINHFSELISQLKGKKLYVDIWRSTCGPCRREFQYKDSLDMVLKQYDVIPLYISLDDDSQDEKWKVLVYANDLKGVHFRANRSFINDLSILVQDEQTWNGSERRSFSIPWYMLIDENGNIVEKQAKRPSEIVVTKRLFD